MRGGQEDREREERAAGERRFWTRGTTTLFVVLGFLLSLVIVWMLLNVAARRAVERELTAIRAKGEPASPDELAPPPVPEKENAAAVFQDAFLELDAARARMPAEEWAGDWETWDFEEVGKNLENVEKALGIHAEALRLAREALSRPRCRFDLDYHKGLVAMDLGHLARLRGLARVLRAEARVRAHAGRAEDAARGLLDVLRLARALEDEPLFMSKHVQVAILGIGTSALKEIARDGPLPDRIPKEVVREIVAELGRYDCCAVQRQAMLGERALSGDAAMKVAAGELDFSGMPRTPSVGPRILVRLVGFHFMNDAARLIRAQTELLEAARLPPWKALPRARSVVARIDALPVWRAPFTKLFTPALDAVCVRFIRSQADLDAARLGLACELYRSRHGRYPARLEELAPEFIPKLPPDPFTGKEFRFVPRGKGGAEGDAKGDGGAGFVVYSVGENLTDEGGLFKQWRDGDIVWEANVPRPRPSE